MPKVVHLSADRWSFGRARSRGFPPGFVERVLRDLHPGQPFLHLCCGWARIRDAVNVDVTAEGGRAPDLVADALCLPFRTGAFNFTLVDPPYEQYDAVRLYGTPPLPLYKLLAEVSRVTAPSGRYAVLYPFSPMCLSGDTRTHEIAVTLASHMRPRMFNVFARGMMPGVPSHQYLATNPGRPPKIRVNAPRPVVA